MKEKNEVLLAKTPDKKADVSRGIRKKHDAKSAADKAVETIGGKKPYGLLPPLEILPFQSTLAYAFKSVGGKETAIEAARMVQDEDERFKKITYAWDLGFDS